MASLSLNPKIVSIGGGSGSFTILGQLKHWTPSISAIVNMSDDGGSTGELRDELGVLPPGDIRQCLVALSNHPETRELFSYRFGKGKLANHAVGNIILSALELQTGSFIEAVRIVSDFMRITGRVIPVTADKNTLMMQDGKELIEGEFNISRHVLKNADAKVYLKPKAKVNKEALKAITLADLVIIAPGNLYGSLLPALIVEGMAEAITLTKAKVVMVANLVNKPKQTYGWHVVDYVKQIERYTSVGAIDIVLYNTKLPSADLLKRYAEDNELPLDISKSRFKEIKAEAIGADLIANKVFKADPNDKVIRRTLIRHDAVKVYAQLARLIKQERKFQTT